MTRKPPAMRELSLFSGAAGGLLATKHLLGWETVGYVENNEYCQKVLQARIADGLLDAAPIFGDIRAFIRDGYADAYQGVVDVASGGFPCQPFSCAGKRLGEHDLRNMWPATIDAIRIIRPRFCFLENVPGLLSSGYFGRILGDLASGGYDARWVCVSGYALGLGVKGERLFVVAKADGGDGNAWVGALEDWQGQTQKSADRSVFSQMWLQTVDSNAGSYNGMANYVERVGAVGNGQFPALAATAWRLLSGE